MFDNLSMDIPTLFGFVMLFASAMSTRSGRRDAKGTWRSAYGVLVLSILHIGFLYQFFMGPDGRLGSFGSEEWAAITAAAIAGIAADDDADAVGLLLVLLGIAQVAMLAGVLALRTAN